MQRNHTHKDNLQVLYEDNHLIVVNKRCGDLVQGDKTGDLPLNEIVKAYLKEKYNKPGNVYLGVVHRLDRPTSGVVLFAKTSKALTRLNRMFARNQPEKTYWAIVKNPPPKTADTLVHYLKRRPKNNKSYAHLHEIPGSKKSVLHYKLLKTLKQHRVLSIKLETGRHHQIRSQLSQIKCPIVGDLKYGFNKNNPDGGIHLHAKSLKIKHPVRKETFLFEAPTPKNALWHAATS